MSFERKFWGTTSGIFFIVTLFVGGNTIKKGSELKQFEKTNIYQEKIWNEAKKAHKTHEDLDSILRYLKDSPLATNIEVLKIQAEEQEKKLVGGDVHKWYTLSENYYAFRGLAVPVTLCTALSGLLFYTLKKKV